mgnify:CR=1 FL=1
MPHKQNVASNQPGNNFKTARTFASVDTNTLAHEKALLDIHSVMGRPHTHTEGKLRCAFHT